MALSLDKEGGVSLASGDSLIGIFSMKKSSCKKRKRTWLVILLFLLLLISGGAWKWWVAKKEGRRVYALTEKLLSFGPRTPGSKGAQATRQWISQTLGDHGWVAIEQSIVRQTPKGEKTFTNLIFRYSKTPLSSQQLLEGGVKGILSAHLDSKVIEAVPHFLGADDAASACALVMELAMTLSRDNPELASQLELVFFDGEEAYGENISIEPQDGLYGSRAYANSLYERREKPSFGIVLDMVGHHNLSIKLPADSPSFLKDVFFKHIHRLGYAKHFGEIKRTRYNPRGAVIDDHLYLNKAQVPTIDIIGDFSSHNWWHQHGDSSLNNVSADSLQISYEVTLAVLRELL